MKLKFYEVRAKGAVQYRVDTQREAKAKFAAILDEFGEASIVDILIEGTASEVVNGVLGEVNEDGTRARCELVMIEAVKGDDGRIRTTTIGKGAK